jgi:hypothetical protein
MTKRPKPAAKPDPNSEALIEAGKEDAGLGVSDCFVDRAFWLPYYLPDEAWYTALEKLDRTGDKTLLIQLLEGDGELSRTIRHYMADLLRRYVLKRPPGNQRTPSY